MPTVSDRRGGSPPVAASKTFLDADHDLLDRLPLLLRLTARYAPFLLRGQASSYRLNLATVDGGAQATVDGGTRGNDIMTKLGVSLTACLLALPLPAGAQDLAISGIVADQTGGVLPGVTVEVAGPGLADPARVAVTDGEGRYVVDGLPAGDYSVSFSLPGFETTQRDGVSATGSDGAALDVVLQFASFSDEVTVVGSKLDTGRQEFGTSVAYLGQERLESDAIFTVEDAFNRTANAFTGTAQFGAYSIRGVNNNGLDSGFGNANALALSVSLSPWALGEAHPLAPGWGRQGVAVVGPCAAWP